MKNETYLTDGVYALFDGESVRLRAPRLDGDHEIYFGQEVWAALNRFMKDNHLNWKVT